MKNYTFTGFGLKIQDKPCDVANLEFDPGEETYISGVLEIELGELIDNDREKFLDLLEERLISEGHLSNVDFRIVGCSNENTLLIRVSGEVTVL